MRESPEKRIVVLNVIAAVFTAIAGAASAIVAFQFFQHERNAYQDSRTAYTIEILLQHREILAKSEIGSVCLLSYSKLSIPIRRDINRLMGSNETFECKSDWCNWLRQCIGRSSEQVEDGETVKLNDSEAWRMGVEIGNAMESYNRLALLYSEDVVDRAFFRKFLEYELQMDQPPVIYLRAANETYSADMQYACLSRLIAEVNGRHEEVPSHWEKLCPDA